MQPIDRSGNAPNLHLNFNTYNRISEHMSAASSSSSSRAIAVLSYDKRGVGKSQSNPYDKNFYYKAGMMDLVKDAVEAVRFVSNHPRM